MQTDGQMDRRTDRHDNAPKNYQIESYVLCDHCCCDVTSCENFCSFLRHCFFNVCSVLNPLKVDNLNYIL